MLQEPAEAVDPLPIGQGIPRAQWSRFLEHISREHQGEQAMLELAKPQSGDPVAATRQRFRSIAVDGNYIDNRIAIVLECASGMTTTHTLSNAAQVRSADASRSALSTLSIATVSGTVAVLRFREPATPDQ